MRTAILILVTVLELMGLSISVRARKWKIFVFYTQLSNLAALLSCVLCLLFGFNDFTVCVRYVSSCMLAMTFLITLFVLVPMGGGFQKLMLKGNGIYHHTLCPILSVGSYLFLEPHCDLWVIPVILTMIYGLTMMYMNWAGKYDGPYPFFKVHQQSTTASIFWIIVLTVIISIISFGITKIN